MSNNHPAKMKFLLLSAIHSTSKVIASVFTSNPTHVFTRKRKLDMEDLITSLLVMGGSSVNNELLKYFNFKPSKVISKPGFVQRRSHLLPDSFEYLLSTYNQMLPDTGLYKGFRTVAVDGSDVNIPYNPKDPET